MNNRVVLLVIGFVLLSLLAWFIVDYTNRPKTAYILLEEVYNKFELKKELEQKFIKTKDHRQKILDSLAFEIKLLGKKIESENAKNKEDIQIFSVKREQFYEKQRTFEEDNQQLSKQYDEQLISQLNQYVSEFGKEKGYQYIFGNDGNGSLMYANDSYNVTKEIIEYINNKYKGLN